MHGSLSFTCTLVKPLLETKTRLQVKHIHSLNPYPNYRLFISYLHHTEEIWFWLLKGESQRFLRTKISSHMPWEELASMWKQLYEAFCFPGGSFVMSGEISLVMSTKLSHSGIGVWSLNDVCCTSIYQPDAFQLHHGMYRIQHYLSAASKNLQY